MKSFKLYKHLLILSFILFFGWSWSSDSLLLTQTKSQKFDEIPLINPPSIIEDESAEVAFIAFGDTRTPDKSKNGPEDRAYHKLRNLVMKRIAASLTPGGTNPASFALFTGDMIYQGGDDYYWKEIYDIFNGSIGDPAKGKIFSVIGNHEAWKGSGTFDPMELYFKAYPYLQDKNQRKLHNYAFTIGQSLFVSLCSGVYGENYTEEDADKWDREWNCEVVSSFDNLMKSFRKLYKEVNARDKIKNIFIQYHKQSFSYFKHPPLDAKNDPLNTLLEFKRSNPDLRVYIFNGHNHTTEIYKPADNVFAVVAGGGGAPTGVYTNVCNNGKPMKELFWKTLGITLDKRQRRINYFTVKLSQDQLPEITEIVLAANKDTGWIGFVEGIKIDSKGNISAPSLQPGFTCNLDDFICVFEWENEIH